MKTSLAPVMVVSMCIVGMLALAGCMTAPGVTAEGWTRLFDGRTLAGWQVKCVAADRDKTYWTVQDGTIVCNSLADARHNYVWLVSEQEYGDFELRLKVRSFADSPGNSGVQVRSRYDDAAGWLDGPQVDLHPPDGWRSGLIYDETRGVRHWIFPRLPGSVIAREQGPGEWKWNRDDWNDVYIRCEGSRIVTRVNGVTIADFNGAGVLDDETHRARRVGLRGHVALQLHTGDRLHIEFKDVQVRPLGSAQ